MLGVKQRVKQLLKERGLTIKNLADMLNVTDGAVSQTINGNPTIGKLKEIADALGVPISDLLTDASDGHTFTCQCGRKYRISPIDAAQSDEP